MTNPDLKQWKEELTKAIQEACPELMELSFGCVVGWKARRWQFVRKHQGKVVLNDMLNWRPIELRDEVFEPFDPKAFGVDIEILGHPITLEHVLKALEGKAEVVIANKSGLLTSGPLEDPLTGQWQLTKPLSVQSEEVVTFLHELLCNSESDE